MVDLLLGNSSTVHHRDDIAVDAPIAVSPNSIWRVHWQMSCTITISGPDIPFSSPFPNVAILKRKNTVR